MSKLEKIEALIDAQKEMYRTYYHQMIGDYNGEQKTALDYKGREILELIQNADDAQSSAIQLELDTSRQTVSICNWGIEPFSIEGVRSLMIPDLSSKVKKKYIGNKGLGFRSVLNWAEQIRIESKGIDLTYSRNIVKKWFMSAFDETTRSKYLSERNFPKDIVPVATLAIPELSQGTRSTGEWLTRIELTYKAESLGFIQPSL